MEDNFRNALIIISAIIIAAIFIHGLWTIRKNKNPYKLKTSDTKIDPVSRDFDKSGFDQDGVSQIRVVKPSALTGEIENPPEDHEIPEQAAPAPEFHEEPLPVDIAEQTQIQQEPTHEPVQPENEPSIEVAPPEAELEPPVAEEPKPVYAEPVIQAKPAAKVHAAKSKAKAKKSAAKKNQFQLNFDDMFDDISIDEPNEPTIGGSEPEPAQEIETEVLVVSVVMPEGHLMSGAVLLPCLLTLGMKFGDMEIFHRHEDNAGNGKVTFSLANMMNPGTFDLDKMENFATQGVTMFMTLPNAASPFEVFENMMAAARTLSQEFNGQILDEKRSVMTKQTEQHYISKIREFERKSRIAKA